MKKKITGIFVTCILMIALAACGAKNESVEGEALETPGAEELLKETGAPETEAPETKTPAPVETPLATEAPETDAPAATKTPAPLPTPSDTVDNNEESSEDKKKPSKNENKKPEATKKPAATKEPEAEGSAIKNASAAYEKAVEGVEFSNMMDISEDMLADAYGIESDILKSYVAKMPMMNVKANEIAVFQVKDKADIDTVKTGIAKRVADLETTWKQYLPDQYELVQNYKISVQGKYVLFVISSDAETVVSNFEKAF